MGRQRIDLAGLRINGVVVEPSDDAKQRLIEFLIRFADDLAPNVEDPSNVTDWSKEFKKDERPHDPKRSGRLCYQIEADRIYHVRQGNAMVNENES